MPPSDPERRRAGRADSADGERPAGGGDEALRIIAAANPSPLTLDGTRTHLVGRRRLAIIDPGPADPAHLDALVRAAEGAGEVRLLLTHDHPDHAAGAPALAERLTARTLSRRSGALSDGESIPTDAGELIALDTPGHTPDHVAFHWPAASTIFCGDLMLGGQDTTLIAAPEGDLRAYLDSLERVRVLGARRIHPTHGPAISDPDAAIDRYVRHRLDRLGQVVRALADGPANADELVERVYGRELDAALRGPARAATRAYLDYLAGEGRARRGRHGRWRLG